MTTRSRLALLTLLLSVGLLAACSGTPPLTSGTVQAKQELAAHTVHRANVSTQVNETCSTFDSPTFSGSGSTRTETHHYHISSCYGGNLSGICVGYGHFRTCNGHTVVMSYCSGGSTEFCSGTAYLDYDYHYSQAWQLTLKNCDSHGKKCRTQAVYVDPSAYGRAKVGAEWKKAKGDSLSGNAPYTRTLSQ